MYAKKKITEVLRQTDVRSNFAEISKINKSTPIIYETN